MSLKVDEHLGNASREDGRPHLPMMHFKLHLPLISRLYSSPHIENQMYATTYISTKNKALLTCSFTALFATIYKV